MKVEAHVLQLAMSIQIGPGWIKASLLDVEKAGVACGTSGSSARCCQADGRDKEGNMIILHHSLSIFWQNIESDCLCCLQSNGMLQRWGLFGRGGAAGNVRPNSPGLIDLPDLFQAGFCQHLQVDIAQALAPNTAGSPLLIRHCNYAWRGHSLRLSTCPQCCIPVLAGMGLEFQATAISNSQ